MNEPSCLQCPIPDDGSGELVTLAHGEGGRLMRGLIRDTIMPAVGNDLLLTSNDAAILPKTDKRLALTTDSFVVSPLFFPGGDIGSLAVFGTVNDLSVAGSRPRWISLALIIEEGLPIHVLESVLLSTANAARTADVKVVTGDTKVVPRGAADRLFINTTGVGEVIAAIPGPSQLQPGDQILVTGPIGRHGTAVMCKREELEFDPTPISDCAPLFDVVAALIDADVPVRAMRDATRGGVAAVLHEWAEMSRLSVAIEAELIPVCPATRGISEVLGLDPLNIANEGTMLVAVPDDAVAVALKTLRQIEQTSSATRIGEARVRSFSPVVVRRSLGQEIPLDEPIGAAMPRIC